CDFDISLGIGRKRFADEIKLGQVYFPAANFRGGSKPIERGVYEVRCAQHDSNGKEKRLQARAGDLQIRIGEAEGQLTVEVLLQTGPGDARAFQLCPADQTASVLATRLRHKGIGNWLERDSVGPKAHIILKSGHSQVEVCDGADGRAIQGQLER